MASQRFNLQSFLIGLIKFIFGVAIALLVISLAGAATARYFLTQLSTLPARPAYDNDAPAKGGDPAAAKPAEAPQADPSAAATAPDANASQPEAAEPETKALYQVVVTYGGGLLIRSAPRPDATGIDGIDYNETVDVLEESDRWYKIRTSSGVEGWVKGRDNTQRL